jgi:1-acyl-sn-glycerol-3-phosphate acyltransferase
MECRLPIPALNVYIPKPNERVQTMLSFLPATVRGVISISLMVLNTIFWSIPFHVLALSKVLIKNDSWHRTCARIIMSAGNCWIWGMNAILRLTQPTTYEIRGLEGLSKHQWYFVNCNHQSWADILVLFYAFTGHIPFFKFFLKKELFWVPLLGICWWALDYPFMERFSRSFLEKNPHMKGKDLETTRKACERYRHTPVSILNFMEGTRFTPEKHSRQGSPYRHLLKPKAGGFAFAMAAMDGKIANILDVTIIYSDKGLSFWDFICGRISRITVLAKKLHVSVDTLTGDYQNDEIFRDRLQNWVCDLWQDKDELIEQHSSSRAQL